MLIVISQGSRTWFVPFLFCDPLWCPFGSNLGPPSLSFLFPLCWILCLMEFTRDHPLALTGCPCKPRQSLDLDLWQTSQMVQDLVAHALMVTAHYPFLENGLVHQVRCKICTIVRGKEKLLTPKLDSLLKHVGCWKAKFLMPSVDVNSHYFNKKLVHAKNEHEFFVVNQLSILD
jgi:hypothetical protein